MGILETAEGWLFGVAIRKGVVALSKLAISYASAVAVQAVLVKYGVTVDPTKLEAELTAGMLVAVEGAHDYLKLKFPSIIKF